MKTSTVIYHSADFDGIFCREVAKHFLGDTAEYIGWDHGNPKIPFPSEGAVYVLDLSPDCFEKLTDEEIFGPLIWIDHHKSSIDKWTSRIPGYRLDGVAACRLTWQWFIRQPNFQGEDILPNKSAFVDRLVKEPMAVRLAGEYDIWDKRDPRAELFQHGLRSCDLTNHWNLLCAHPTKPTISELEGLIDVGHDKNLIEPDGNFIPSIVHALLDAGRSIQYMQNEQNASIIKAYGFDVKFEGLRFLCCNHARFNSLLFASGVREDHDALMGFNWSGKQWRVSLYHAPGREHHDLSVIASKYGGGGHRGACGFVAKELPFMLTDESAPIAESASQSPSSPLTVGVPTQALGAPLPEKSGSGVSVERGGMPTPAQHNHQA